MVLISDTKELYSHMSGAEEFEALLRRRGSFEQIAAADAGRERAAALSRFEQEIRERNLSVEGTAAEEVLSPSDVAFCRSFLDFMARRGNPGTATLRRDIYDHPVHGYRIGFVDDHPAADGEIDHYSRIRTNWWDALRIAKSTGQIQHDVYLCIDGRLRVGAFSTLEGGIPILLNADRTTTQWATIHYTKVVTAQTWVPEQKIPERWDERTEPSNSVVVPDRRYKVRVPGYTIPGHYVQAHVDQIVDLKEALAAIAERPVT